jgi:agmatinase
MNSLPQNFLGLPTRYSDYRRARFAVLPIPYDSTTSFQAGTREGPAAIIRASQQVELFDEELETECHKAGVATLDPLMPNMAGPKAMHEDVFAAAKRIVRDGKFLIGLGGEHSITSSLVRAVMTKHKKLSVLQIDAHLDLRDSWEGSPHSHACVMRRCLELGAKIVPVGIRNVSLEEHRFLKTVIRTPSASEGPGPLLGQRRGRSLALPVRKKSAIRPCVDVVTARQCHTDDDWVDRVLNALGETVYITIDIDGFDPSFAPGTGTPEPGGLDWYQVTGLLRLVAAEKNVVGADIVEVMPIPGQAVTEFLAARLAYKLISYLQTRM